MSLESELLTYADRIGQIYGCNGAYTHLLAALLAQSNKPLGEMTLDELLRFDTLATARYNQIHAPAAITQGDV